jgi:hypothetical protein
LVGGVDNRRVVITFAVDGTPALFQRSAWSGTATLRVADEVFKLQSPFRLSTHFRRSTEKTWTVIVGDHEIEITKVRQRPTRLTADILDAEFHREGRWPSGRTRRGDLIPTGPSMSVMIRAMPKMTRSVRVVLGVVLAIISILTSVFWTPTHISPAYACPSAFPGSQITCPPRPSTAPVPA